MIHYKKNQGHYNLIFSICVAVGVCVTLILGAICNLKDKNIILLLPLGYVGCFFGFRANRRYLNTISISIINIVAICRYIIYPIILILAIQNGENYSFDKKCIWILLYEMLGVFLIIGLFAHKIVKPKQNQFQNSISLGIPNVILIFLLFPILILYPSLLTRFSITSGVAKETSAIGVVEILFTMGIWVLFIFFTTRVAFKEKYRSISFIFVILLAIYYIMFNAVSGEDVKRWQIISCGIAMLYIAIHLFPKQKKNIIAFGVLGILLAVIFGSLIKFSLAGSLSGIFDKFFDVFHFTEYFGGMKNITTALDLFSNNTKVQGYESMLTDLFSGMPIISSLFDYKNSTPALFQKYVGRTDIICPLTSQSVAHFGVLGAPIFAMVMTYLAIMFNKFLNKTRSFYCAYVLIELVVWFSLFMALNTTIILGKMWIRIIFLLVQKINDDIKIKTMGETMNGKA